LERKNNLDIKEIQKVLPQRPSFFFIGRVLEFDSRKNKLTCVKNVTFNDYFFKGHFPGKPVMPEVIILESMAQASVILFALIKPEVAQKKPSYYFGKSEVRFLKPVKVGDRLYIDCILRVSL